MSPPFDISPFPEYCFSMWYLMFGRHTFRKKFDKTYIDFGASNNERDENILFRRLTRRVSFLNVLLLNILSFISFIFFRN